MQMQMPMTKRTTNRGVIFLAVAILTTACGPNQRILQSANENTAAVDPIAVTPNSTPTVSSFDQDLNAMRTADFNFIYVLRRQDGGILTTEDRNFITGMTPREINRRRLSDEGKAVILGSNFRLPPETLPLFRKRFALEDHSKPESELLNANSNL